MSYRFEQHFINPYFEALFTTEEYGHIKCRLSIILGCLTEKNEMNSTRVNAIRNLLAEISQQPPIKPKFERDLQQIIRISAQQKGPLWYSTNTTERLCGLYKDIFNKSPAV